MTDTQSAGEGEPTRTGPSPAPTTHSLVCSVCGYTVPDTPEGEEAIEAHMWGNHIEEREV